jgi:hypothetical protein
LEQARRHDHFPGSWLTNGTIPEQVIPSNSRLDVHVK